MRLFRQIEVETAFGASVAQAFLSLLGTRRFMTRCFSRSKTENSPDYFVKSGRCDLGVAWNDVTEPDDDTARLNISV